MVTNEGKAVKACNINASIYQKEDAARLLLLNMLTWYIFSTLPENLLMHLKAQSLGLEADIYL